MNPSLGGLATLLPAADLGDPTATPPPDAPLLALVPDAPALDAADPTLDFDANLAEGMSAAERDALAEELLELVEADARAREGWDKLAKKGQQMMGLTIDDTARQRAARGGERDEVKGDRKRDDFWTHTAVHPLLADAIVRFQAQAMPELFPPEGPAKGFVLPDDATRELEEQAGRAARSTCPKRGAP
jgi:hypothetical protein